MEETLGYEERFGVGLEDVASYRDFFSTDEWESMNFVEWEEEPEPPPIQLDYSKHTSRVFNPPGQNLGDEGRFDVECDLCGWIAAADTSKEADAIATLHENFVATLVENWSVER